MISRRNRIKIWLETIADDVDKINMIFDTNLISEDDIGSFHHQNIKRQLHNLNLAIEETLFNLENR